MLVQGQRPVLVVHRLFHPWYVEYRKAIDTRIRDTFLAFFAQDVADVNRLVDDYGVTHLVVAKRDFYRNRLRRGHIYEDFDDFIIKLTGDKNDFLLERPPRESVVFEDSNFWLVRLPLEAAKPSGNVAGSQMPQPAGQRQR